MTGFLLDTNVISEMTKESPDPGVISFLSEQDGLWLSPVVLHELEFGLQLLPQGRRRDGLRQALAELMAEYEDHVLPLARNEAEWAARLRAQAHLSGRVLHLGDALIAGTAKAHNLSLATRNIGDFGGLDVNLINPWKTP